MITLKFSWNAKVTRDLTGRSPVGPVADDDFEILTTVSISNLQINDWKYFVKLNIYK